MKECGTVPPLRSDTIKTFTGSGGLNFNELRFLESLCVERNCKNFIEIGRRQGCSTRLFAMLAEQTNGQVVSIDGNSQYLSFVETKLQELHLLHRVTFITAWSPWISFDMDWTFDCLLIDGDHTYVSTLVDYHTFNYFVKKEGLIVFHDIDRSRTFDAMREAAERDSLKPLGRVRKLQVWEKTVPNGSMWEIRKYQSRLLRKE